MGSAFQKERGIVGGNGAIEGFVTAFDLTKAFSSNLKLKFFEPILWNLVFIHERSFHKGEARPKERLKNEFRRQKNEEEKHFEKIFTFSFINLDVYNYTVRNIYHRRICKRKHLKL